MLCIMMILPLPILYGVDMDRAREQAKRWVENRQGDQVERENLVIEPGLTETPALE